MLLAARWHHIAIDTAGLRQIVSYSLKCQDNTLKYYVQWTSAPLATAARKVWWSSVIEWTGVKGHGWIYIMQSERSLATVTLTVTLTLTITLTVRRVCRSSASGHLMNPSLNANYNRIGLVVDGQETSERSGFFNTRRRPTSSEGAP